MEIDMRRMIKNWIELEKKAQDRYIIDGLGRMLGIRQIIPLIDKSQRLDPKMSSLNISINETNSIQINDHDNYPMLNDDNNQINNFSNKKQLNHNIHLINELVSNHINEIKHNELKQYSYHIKEFLQHINIKQIKSSHKHSLGTEWRILALIIDRLFFIIYLFTLITIAGIVILKTDLPDTTLQLINRNVVDLQ
ncbi:unnamed protein product [Schistosoma margrebowiei]|uniref:Uncharacterized protein n=1 Tax=Schistosoma margrebowiei TaxID=48269 RepID=A0A183M463_9TREM|nr:unnamed protein product [Schistosoma margrebowiei]